MSTIAELRGGYEALAGAHRLQAASEHLTIQGDQVACLQLELRLVGRTAAARRHLLAVYDAEVRARQMGLAANSEKANEMKTYAASIAGVTTELERQREAWDNVQRAAEAMIDGPLDAILQGDLKGALASVVKEFGGFYIDLAIRNPLKNPSSAPTTPCWPMWVA